MSEGDSDTPFDNPTDDLAANTPLTDLGIHLYTEEDQLILQLPPEHTGDWPALWQQLQLQLQARERIWKTQAQVEIRLGHRLLDQWQIQQLSEALGAVDIAIERICTSRRQTAIAAATLGYGVEQLPPNTLLQPLDANSSPPQVAPLYLQTTLRSGHEICHPGSVIVRGDLNPGSSIIASGDILVWGRVRGVVHAGANGNMAARIMGLYLAATQLRIGDLIARSPTPPQDFYPEVAYATSTGIQIAPASHFSF